MFDGDALLQTPLVVNPVDFHRVRRRFYDEAGSAPFNRQEAIDPITVAWDWPCWIDWNPPAVPPI